MFTVLGNSVMTFLDPGKCESMGQVQNSQKLQRISLETKENSPRMTEMTAQQAQDR